LVLPAADSRLAVPPGGLPAATRSRVLGLGLLTLVVLLLHLALVNRYSPDRLGEGAAERAPQRIEVAFVRELAPTAPPPPVIVAAAPRPRAAAPARTASAPAEPIAEAAAPPLAETDATATALLPPPEPAPAVPEAVALPERRDLSATTSPINARTAATESVAPTAFEWPPSTRLSYTLTGDYRGPVQGQATVEWLRSGTRYQVHLDVSVGPSFAPLLSRRITSEGEITERGLQPRRYDEETKVAFASPRRLTVWLDGNQVRLPNGTQLSRPEGVQDSASQFVQMTWLFTTQPQWLVQGRTIELPLALPRRVEPWLYDVLETTTLDTPAGPVEAVHVKPRRDATRAGLRGDLAAEFWVAPSLQYLPVRIVIRQDENTHIDLLIERLPQQAAPGR